MNSTQFAEQLAADLKGQIAAAEFAVRKIEKLQNESYTGIIATPSGSSVGASINIDSLFKDYENGVDYNTLVKKAEETVKEAFRQMPEINAEEILNYPKMKENLTMQLISIKGHEEMLKDIPYKAIDDFAAICRFELSNTDRGVSSIIVKYDMLDNFGISHEQLFNDAEENAPKLHPPTLRNMSEVLSEMTGGILDGPPSPMWVASVEGGMNGAGVLAYPDFLEQSAEQLGSSFYVLPSSIHELLFIPDEGAMPAKELSEMVSSINETEVAAPDRLSDCAYHYDAESHLFEKAAVYENRMNEIETAQQGLEVLVVEPGQYPHIETIGSDLSSLQETVGGSIEACYFFEDNVALVCNEEGKLIGLPLNRAIKGDDNEIVDIIAGKFFICGLGDEDFASLPKDLQKKYEEKFHSPEAFLKMGKSIKAFPTEPDLPSASREKSAKGMEL